MSSKKGKGSNKIFVTLGASNHTWNEREENDFYATHPIAVEHLLRLEKFQRNILEPMCGQGHIAKVLEKYGHKVKAFDLIDRGYGKIKNVFDLKFDRHDFDIISNPPYKNSEDYVYKCLSLLTHKPQKLAFFLKLLFLESRKRKILFKKFPPKTVWVASGRIHCAKHGDFSKCLSSPMAFAWFIWEYGYKGDTVVKWFN